MNLQTKFLSALMLLLAAIAPPADGQDHSPDVSAERYYADAYADHYAVPRELVRAIIGQESGWNPQARSEKGAMGLMQLMPETARRYGVERPFDVEENISAGVQFLRALIDAFHGDLRLVAAGYYCGPRYLLQRGLNYSNPDVFAYVQGVRRRFLEEAMRTQVESQLAGNAAAPKTTNAATNTGDTNP